MVSKPIINYGINTTININGNESKEYFKVVNINYYNTILGTAFLKKYESLTSYKIVLRLKAELSTIKQVTSKYHGINPIKYFNKALEPEKPPASPKDSHRLSPTPTMVGMERAWWK